jgi:MYXO-CTERM domain-containing protein
LDYGSNFTIEFYFRYDDLPTPVTPFRFMSLADENSGFTLLPLSGGGRIRFLGGDEAGTGADAISDSFVASEDTWYHLAFVKSGASYQFYLDGTALGSGPLPGFDSIVLTATNTLFIGNLFDGRLDEIRISDEALTPSQFLNAIPEPSSLALAAAGLAALAALRRRASVSRCRHGLLRSVRGHLRRR